LRTARPNPSTGLLAAAALWGLLPVLVLAGCSDLNWPFHHPSSAPVSVNTGGTSAGGDSTAAECADIRAQIRQNAAERREAPATTTDPNIVDAAQGKADKRIDDLHQRAEAMDCPSDAPTDAPSQSNRMAPVQPAPGGGNR
jgi:hypothetical protein